MRASENAISEVEVEDLIEEEEERKENNEIPKGPLDTFLSFYDCYDLLPYAHHILQLASIKEVLGFLPFNLDWEDIRALVILKEEQSRKSIKDSQEMRDSRGSSGSSNSGFSSGAGLSTGKVNVPLSKMVLKK
jgi:hypothetical protein